MPLMIRPQDLPQNVHTWLRVCTLSYYGKRSARFALELEYCRKPNGRLRKLRVWEERVTLGPRWEQRVRAAWRRLHVTAERFDQHLRATCEVLPR